MSDIEVPKRLRDITPEWLTTALTSSGDVPPRARVVSFEPRTIGVGIGFVGRCLLLELSWEPAGAGPRSVVAKMPSAFAPSRQIADEGNLYRTEAGFYRELVGRMPATSPRCYWSGYDAASGDFLLLLEDLSRLRGGEHQDGCSERDARAAIVALAGIHAAWWESDELRRMDWLPTTDKVMDSMIYSRIDAAWPSFVGQFSGRLEPSELAALDRLRLAVPHLRRLSLEVPDTLAHGDYRLENFFFDDQPEGPRIVVLDWQLASRGAGSRDVGYFLGWNLTPEQRAERERSLIRLYHDELQAHGVSGYGFERCWSDYLIGLMMTSLFVVGQADRLEETSAAAALIQGPAAEVAMSAMRRNEELQLFMLRRSVRAVIETGACDLLTA